MQLKDHLRFIKRHLYHKNQIETQADPMRFYDYILSKSETLEFQFVDESPIFIFSTSWRAGSTLLQRLVTSSSNCLVWGEPYDKSNPIQALSNMLSPVNETWPPSGYFRNDFADLSNQWIANLYPDLKSMLMAHRAFLGSFFVESANSKGFDNWGLKEVRFGLKEILYLKLFFPNAKVLLLNRTLEDAFSSYLSFSKNMHWYDVWPNKQISNAYKFARHHKRLNKDFRIINNKFNDLIVEYDSLITDENCLKQIDEHCGITCDRRTLNAKVGSGSAKSSKHSNQVSIKNKVLLSLGSV